MNLEEQFELAKTLPKNKVWMSADNTISVAPLIESEHPIYHGYECLYCNGVRFEDSINTVYDKMTMALSAYAEGRKSFKNEVLKLL